MVIAQSDLANIAVLRTPGASQNQQSGNTIIIATDAANQQIANFANGPTSVESKGLASMKSGEQKAREQAMQDAIRNAVQQAQGVMLQGKSGMFNDALAMALSTKQKVMLVAMRSWMRI